MHVELAAPLGKKKKISWFWGVMLNEFKNSRRVIKDNDLNNLM